MAFKERIIVVCGLSIRKKWLRYLGYYTLPNLADTYELWDLSAFCDKHDNAVSFDDEIEEREHIHFMPDAESFLCRLRKLGAEPRPTYIFPLSTRPPEFLDIWRASSGTNLYLCNKVHKDHPPNPFRPVSLWGQGRRVKQKMKWIINNARLAIRHGRPYCNFYATPRFVAKWGAWDGFAPREYIHTLNYDKVLAMDCRKPTTEPYAVYIDQNLPVDHQVQVGGEEMMSEEVFWNRMRALFDQLKTEADLEDVVVCAHPNRSEESIEQISSFSRVVQFETEQWIRDCALVVAHASTALDFAVIFKKPTCFVSQPEMKRNEQFAKMTQTYASKLGRQVNVLSDTSTGQLDWGRDDEAYRQFRKNFIKQRGTPDVNSWEYIVRVLRKTSPPLVAA